jgi:two-component system, LuxR family, response regulator FixJ
MPSKPITVLVVDDDAAVRSSLKFALEAEGLEVRLYDGPAALLADGNLLLDACLVVDYRMPSMDGLELIASLNARKTRLPTILITDHATQELRRRAAVMGVGQVIEKPLSGNSLVECVRLVLSKSP